MLIRCLAAWNRSVSGQFRYQIEWHIPLAVRVYIGVCACAPARIHVCVCETIFEYGPDAESGPCLKIVW